MATIRLAATGAPATLGQTFGEMVWLLTQSPLHKELKLKDLEWLLMPPLMLGQARIFRAGPQPVGLALWAYLTPEEAEALGKAGRLDPNGWRHGTDVMDIIKAEKAGKPTDLTLPAVKEGELELWLVDLLCPFATPQNKLTEACLADLITGPLKGAKLKMHKTDPKTLKRSVVVIGEEK
jgi:cytolysin-activating lysine-acyltransferase